MTLQLTQELEQLVQTSVESGRYKSASEVVREALQLLADRDHLIDLRRRDLQTKIAQGLESLERGEGVDGDEFFDQLEREEGALESHP